MPRSSIMDRRARRAAIPAAARPDRRPRARAPHLCVVPPCMPTSADTAAPIVPDAPDHPPLTIRNGNLVDARTGRVLAEGGTAGFVDGRPAFLREQRSLHDSVVLAVPLDGADPRAIVTVHTHRTDLWGVHRR